MTDIYYAALKTLLDHHALGARRIPAEPLFSIRPDELRALIAKAEERDELNILLGECQEANSGLVSMMSRRDEELVRVRANLEIAEKERDEAVANADCLRVAYGGAEIFIKDQSAELAYLRTERDAAIREVAAAEARGRVVGLQEAAKMIAAKRKAFGDEPTAAWPLIELTAEIVARLASIQAEKEGA